MIMAAMATMPERAPYLREAVESIRPQVDTLRVYLNGFDAVPDCLSPDEVVFSQEADGNLCAEGKFYWYDKEEGSEHEHYLTIDDDLRYPPDYAERMREEFTRRQGRAVIGIHGFVFDNPIESYVTSRKERYRFNEELDTPKSVHILGTNTTLLGHSAISLSMSDFPRRNTSDLQMAFVAQREGVPFISIPRPRDWIVETRPVDDGFSIWNEAKQDRGRTKAALARMIGDWKLFPDPLTSDQTH